DRQRRRRRYGARPLHRQGARHCDGGQDLGRVRGRRRFEVRVRVTGGARMTKVLVIDDEPPIRLLCRVNLEAEGMQVIEAENGPAGLQKAREEDPDVVLLDVMMPGLDGWHVAQELLESDETAEIPIIFLTARAEFRDRAKGLGIGGVDYVTKP